VKLVPSSNGTSRSVAVRESLAESTDSTAFPQDATDRDVPLLNGTSFTTDG